MKSITVSASEKYKVIIGRDLLADAGRLISDVTGVCTAVVVTDDTVNSLYGNDLCQSLEKAGFRVSRFVFPHGEQSKNLDVYEQAVNYLASLHITRTDILIALGGGVVGDLCGFAAATYLRGMRYIQVPTTLLAAVDSSVGGKTAVDLPAGKNLIGCFHQPSLVLCDYKTLDTLSDEIYRDGCAEIIKTAVLTGGELYRAVAEKQVREQYEYVISECVQLKSKIVSEDEFDRGQRAFLNLGHSFGHAVEAGSNFSVSHGSAVAVGMAIVARAAARKGFCTQTTANEIISLLKQYGLPVETGYSADMLLKYMLSDKKMTGDTIHLIVPESIGHCSIEAVAATALRSWLNDAGIE